MTFMNKTLRDYILKSILAAACISTFFVFIGLNIFFPNIFGLAMLIVADLIIIIALALLCLISLICANEQVYNNKVQSFFLYFTPIVLPVLSIICYAIYLIIGEDRSIELLSIPCFAIIPFLISWIVSYRNFRHLNTLEQVTRFEIPLAITQ